jgi:DNA-binding NarL/FixJ family response regulator
MNSTRTARRDATRVFVVDDHAVVRRGVRVILEAAGGFDVVGEASDARAGLEGILATRPDVALVDVHLPSGAGAEVIREVRSRQPQIRCLIFTSFAEDNGLYQAVLAGAAGFVHKDWSSATLVECLRAVGDDAMQLTHDDVDRYRHRTRVTDLNDQLVLPLTAQERRVLDLMTRGLTNGQIAEGLALAEKTVRNYVTNILAKVGVRNRTEAAAMVARSPLRDGHRVVPSRGVAHALSSRHGLSRSGPAAA